jgi:hypothetical protein
MVIGIRWEGATDGMKDIGLGHHIQELAGWHLITMESGSSKATGKEIADGLNMTTAGTATATEILAGAGAGTATRTATGTTMGTAIGTAANSAPLPDPLRRPV